MSSPQQRLSSITNHVSGGAAARQQLLSKNPDDVVCEIAQKKKEMKNVAKKNRNRSLPMLLELLSPRPERVV